jgi:hypothetical protein
MSSLILGTVVDRDHCDSEYGPGMDSHGYILDMDEHSTEMYHKLSLQFSHQDSGLPLGRALQQDGQNICL